METTVERVMPGTESWDYYGVEHVQRYHFFESFYAGKTVLDAACGTGFGSKYISDCGASSVTGVDISDEALSFAKNNYKASGLEYLKHDCMKITELGKKFDVVVSFETIEHLTDPAGFVKQVKAVLNPGGVFICSTPNKKRLSGAGFINEFHINELEYDDFKKIIKSEMDLLNEYHQSESIGYFRYMELKYLLSRAEGRSNAFFFSRIEKGLRKLVGKDFKKEPFIRKDLERLFEKDMYIEELAAIQNWHKTYIIVARYK
jgi:2-polyprenyl-3-methyl-5-hydroxy-6-metoxy-1,4-benzoquinol methylase